MRFSPTQIGCFVEIPGGLDEASIRGRCTFPAQVLNSAAFSPWLEDVQNVAAMVSDMAAGSPKVRPGELSDWLEALTGSADRMRRGLGRLEAGRDRAELFDMLQPIGDYILWRASPGAGDSAGRPVVPPVHSAAPTFAALLERMADDLDTLTAVCAHQQRRLVGLPTSTPAHGSRRLVNGCASAFRSRFGTLPPRRSWFGDDFMPYVGACIGLEIGWRVVAEAVGELGEHPGAG